MANCTNHEDSQTPERRSLQSLVEQSDQTVRISSRSPTSMAAEIPPSLKLITSALRRAEELDKDANPEARIVAYYCRYYCVSKGSKLCSVPPIPAETKFLIDEMGKLEKFKATSGEAMSQERGLSVCKAYADGVFQKADDEDRAGAADKATAKLFYAAGTFYDILEQFGDLPNEVIW